MRKEKTKARKVGRRNFSITSFKDRYSFDTGDIHGIEFNLISICDIYPQSSKYTQYIKNERACFIKSSLTY